MMADLALGYFFHETDILFSMIPDESSDVTRPEVAFLKVYLQCD